MPVHKRTKLHELDSHHGVVISRCYNIMKLWGFTQSEIATVLDISTSSLRRYLANPDRVRLNRDRHDRASNIINIHIGLTSLLSTNETIYGFIAKPSHDDFFSGRMPKQLLLEGSMENLIDLTRYVQYLSDGCSS